MSEMPRPPLLRVWAWSVCLSISHWNVHLSNVKRHYLLACNSLLCGRILPTYSLLLASCWLHDMLFYPEDEGSALIRNADKLPPDYTALYPSNNTLYSVRSDNLNSIIQGDSLYSGPHLFPFAHLIISLPPIYHAWLPVRLNTVETSPLPSTRVRS